MLFELKFKSVTQIVDLFFASQEHQDATRGQFFVNFDHFFECWFLVVFFRSFAKMCYNWELSGSYANAIRWRAKIRRKQSSIISEVFNTERCWHNDDAQGVVLELTYGLPCHHSLLNFQTFLVREFTACMRDSSKERN